jgi:hypothetical protein
VSLRSATLGAAKASAVARLLVTAVTAVTVSLGCDPGETSVGAWDPTTQVYVEAESAELSGAFVVGSDPAASAGHYIVADAGAASDTMPGAARAHYSVHLATTGTYVIWGRIHSPSASTNRFWIQLDGGPWFIWRITVGDIWFWDALHDNVQYGQKLTFDLPAGAHDLVIANCVDGAELDRLYFTSAGDTPPGNDTPCDPPNSIDIDGSCLPSCGSQGGNACGADACAGLAVTHNYDCAICCTVP